MIELIVVIIILGIMSVTMLPKFFNSSGFQEYSYQAEVITKLRAIQIRAMQQTLSSKCHMVLVTEFSMGIPNNCTDISNGWQSETSSVVLQSGDGVTFDVSGGNYSFIFDAYGIPDCTNCTLTLLSENGESNLTVVIESQGYIHEG